MPDPANHRTELGAPATEARSAPDATLTVPAGSEARAPSNFGPYQIVKELGKGGMGAVYAAIDTRLDRQLALKVMLPEFATDPTAKERFIREAKAVAKVGHDNVVTIYEADERDGVPYIAMQFLQGAPLDRYLKEKGNPSVQQVLRIAVETAAGLAAAHRLGLVHRDIKPGNLWLEAPHGRIKILDFGLAKPIDAEVELTKSGAVVGTPAYMSPEQARAEKVDHRSDLFSLGAVLYRLCAGKPPFQRATTMATLMALGTEDARPLLELNPAVPESFAQLVHELLAKDPDARPQSAAEVVKRVRAIAEELAAPHARNPELSVSQPQVVRPQVVYAVLPVAADDANPFADLDAPRTEVDAEAAPPVATARDAQPGARRLWPAVGLLTLVAVATASALVIANKLRTEPNPEPPEGTADKGKEVKPQPNPPAPDPERRAALWVLSQGGTVGVDDAQTEIKAAADLPKAPFVVTFVNLHTRPIADAGLAQLKGCAQLKHLNLSATPVTDAGLAHFKECKQLRELVLYGTAITDAGAAHFKGCDRLQRLNLHSTQVGDTGLAAFKGCTELTHLALNTNVSDVGLAHFKDCKNLGILSIGSSKVTDAGLVHLLDWKQLYRLDLSHTELTDAGLAHLREHTHLNYLDVSGTKIGDAGLAHIHGHANLRTIILQNTRITNEGLTTLAGCKNLTDLYLAGTAIGDAGLAHLKGFAKLKHLDLNATRVTDAGLAHLPVCAALSTLNLSATAVTDAGLEHLNGCLNLTELNVVGTKVTAKGAAALHAAVPGCRIVYDGGTIEAIDLDRKAAEWVLAQGGVVRVPGSERDIRAAADLPKERFALSWVNLDGTKVTDDGLANLKDLRQLEWLHIGNTAVTDRGLANLGAHPHLTILNAARLKVSDAGLAALKQFPRLELLVLFGTPITDAALVHIKELKGLKHLSAQQSAFSLKAAMDLQATLPACGIEYAGGVLEPIDADRKAAEWVLAQGGAVRVSGRNNEIKGVADLPKERFVLARVYLNSTKATGTDLANLKGLSSLEWLDLYNAPVTDAGLVHVAEHKTLTKLTLNGTQVTDAGLAHLKPLQALLHLDARNARISDAGLAHLRELKALTNIELGNTQVTDAGLVHLRDLKGLVLVNVRRTKVTAQGAADLSAALPGCRIEHDGGTIEPKK